MEKATHVQDLRLLLVEDNPGDARLVREMFRDQTAVVIETVESLGAALVRLAESPPDAVLLDLGLPDSQGLATVQAVLEASPAPVVVLTGNDDFELGESAVHLGAQDYLVKAELTARQLPRAVRYAIERSKTKAQIHHVNQFLQAVRQISQLIVLEKDPERLLSQACAILLHTRGYRAVWIGLGDVAGCGSLAVQHGWDGPAVELAAQWRDGRLPPCWEVAIPTAYPTVTRRCPENVACPICRRSPEGQVVVTVISHEGRVLGVLAASLEVAEPLAEERSLLAEITGDLGLALHGIAIERHRASYAQIVAGSQEAMALIGPNGACVVANDAFAALTGREEPAILGQTLREIWGEEIYRRSIEPLLVACLDGQMRTSAMELVVPGAGTRFLEASYAPCGDSKGVIIGAAVCLHDTTDRHQAEAALRVSESKYAAIFRSSPDAILLTSVNEERVIELNEAAARLARARPEDLIGRTTAELKLWTDPDAREAYKTRLLRYGRVAEIEIQFQTMDGNLIDCLVSGELVELADGQHLLTVIRDISARKRIEAERERLLTAIEQTGEVIIITDVNGVIKYVNPAFERVTGYTREEALGQTPRLLKSGAHDTVFYQHLWGTIAAGKTWQGRLVNRRKDDGRYTETATISPVYGPAGGVTGYVAVKRDITDQLHLEAQYHQAQRMESVGRLAAGIAHEYNNQLTVIGGFAQMIGRRLGPEHPLRADLAEITAAVQRSADLTRQLLTFARQQPMEPKILDLNDTVGSALKMLRQLIGENIELTWRPAVDLWPVRIDPGQVVQLLANLCVNSRDAITGAGRISLLTANLSVDDHQPPPVVEMPAGEYVVLSVSDNGSGMDSQTLERIFEPFFTTKGVGKGTGLGLATVYGIVAQNHGYLDVASQPGLGTTFAIYLPRFATQATSATTATSLPLLQGRGETVLVVEDEPSILRLASQLLRELGYRTIEAATPEKALELASAPGFSIDLLLTDVVMPGMDGRQLATRLQAAHPGVPCLFMSGYTAEAISRYGALDQEAMVAKPFSSEELAAGVRRLLDHSAAISTPEPIP